MQSLDYIAGLGMERIEAHTLAMSGALRQRLVALGVPVMTPEPAAARAGSIAFEHADPLAVREALEAVDVLVTGELGRVRASVHVYTTDEDLAHRGRGPARGARLVDADAEVGAKLARRAEVGAAERIAEVEGVGAVEGVQHAGRDADLAPGACGAAAATRRGPRPGAA